MKKTVWSLWIVSDDKEAAGENVPLFVYRHCSVIPVHKIKRLAEKFECDLSKFFVAVFSFVLFKHFKEPIRLFSIMNKKDCLRWESTVHPTSFLKTVRHCEVISHAKAELTTVESRNIRFEVKIVKNVLMLSFYYPEDFQSEVLSSEILGDIDELLRNLLKSASS